MNGPRKTPPRGQGLVGRDLDKQQRNRSEHRERKPRPAGKAVARSRESEPSSLVWRGSWQPISMKEEGAVEASGADEQNP